MRAVLEDRYVLITEERKSLVFLKIDQTTFEVEIINRFTFKKSQPWAIEAFGDSKQFIALLNLNPNEIYIYEIREIPGIYKPNFEFIFKLQIDKFTSSPRNNNFFLKNLAMIGNSFAVTELPKCTCVAVQCSLERNMAGFLKLYFLSKGNKKVECTRFLDLSELGVGRLYNLNFGGIFGDFLVVNGFTNHKNPDCLTFVYNFKTKEFEENLALRTSKVDCDGVYSFFNVDGKEFVGISRDGKYVKFSYSLKMG